MAKFDKAFYELRLYVPLNEAHSTIDVLKTINKTPLGESSHFQELVQAVLSDLNERKTARESNK